MLLSVELGIAIFVIIAGFGYLHITSRDRKRHQARAQALIAAPELTLHEELMRKYDCVMSEQEASELQKANWR